MTLTLESAIFPNAKLTTEVIAQIACLWSQNLGWS